MAEQKTEHKVISLKINDRDVQVPPGTLLIEATRRIGTEVPSFCYYPGLSLQAACRMCLVEIEKMPKLQTACTVIATEGMIVRTDTPQVRQALFSRALDNAEVMAKVRRPVLLLHGAQDAAVDPVVVAQHQAAMPHARARTLQAAGHVPFWEDAPTFNAHLREFCQSL